MPTMSIMLIAVACLRLNLLSKRAILGESLSVGMIESNQLMAIVEKGIDTLLLSNPQYLFEKQEKFIPDG